MGAPLGETRFRHDNTKYKVYETIRGSRFAGAALGKVVAIMSLKRRLYEGAERQLIWISRSMDDFNQLPHPSIARAYANDLPLWVAGQNELLIDNANIGVVFFDRTCLRMGYTDTHYRPVIAKRTKPSHSAGTAHAIEQFG